MELNYIKVLCVESWPNPKVVAGEVYNGRIRANSCCGKELWDIEGLSYTKRSECSYCKKVGNHVHGFLPHRFIPLEDDRLENELREELKQSAPTVVVEANH